VLAPRRRTVFNASERMHKRPFFWPTDRSLFRRAAKRRGMAVGLVVALALLAAGVVVVMWPAVPR
jgi:hypothetical protein